MPDMPVIEAMASICMSIASKIRSLGFGPLKFELQHPVCLPSDIEDAHVGARVLANIPDRLAEELKRERGVRLVHVVDL